ncbi:unnamed protein product [Ectocarpus sp. 6 AP-2014]
MIGQTNRRVGAALAQRAGSGQAAQRAASSFCSGRGGGGLAPTSVPAGSARSSLVSRGTGSWRQQQRQPWQNHQRQQQSRALSYRFGVGQSWGGGGDVDDPWPVSHPNSLVNVCPQGSRMVVERLGKLSSIERPGWFIAIPVIDKIAYRVDMRERNISITPQAAITKDNVSVEVSGNLYVQFEDPEKAAYGSANPLYAVRQHAQSSMRASIGELELDEILHARAQLNSMIKDTLQSAADAWGMEVKRYEITEITPDAQISEAMDKQAAAERIRRERVLTAEGEKKAYTLQSEGVKIQLINESEGKLIQVQNAAKADKERIRLEAEGEAEARLVKAQAEAKALAVVAEALRDAAGSDAAQLQIAKQYIDMYGEMGKSSNTMLFSDRPADVNALIAQASAVLSSAGAASKAAAGPEPGPPKAISGGSSS